MQYENLHTYALEKLFGTLKLRIIRQSEDLRIIELNDDDNISRTFGIVRFINVFGESLEKAHYKIRAGALLGKTLYDSDIAFDKKFIGSLQVKLPNWLKEDFKSEYDNGLAFYSKISVSDEPSSIDEFLYSELIEVIPLELEGTFKNKIVRLKKIDKNVLSLLHSADIEANNLESKL